MATPSKSLDITEFTLNSVDLLSPDVLQKTAFESTAKTVDARGLADRYALEVVTKRKSQISYERLFYNSVTDLPSPTTEITVYDLGGTAYLGDLHSGSLSINNSGPDVSSAGSADEIPIPTTTGAELTTDLFVYSEAEWTNAMLTATVTTGYKVLVAITFNDGEAIAFPGVLKATTHSLDRGMVQMENVRIGLSGTPTGGGTSGSDLYVALMGSATVPIVFDTSANLYETGESQYAMISKCDIQFARDEMVRLSGVLEFQGLPSFTAGS